MFPGRLILPVDYWFPDKIRGFQAAPCASSLWSPLRGSAAKLMLGICLKARQVFDVLDSHYTTMTPRRTTYMPSLTASLYGVGIVSVSSRSHAKFTKVKRKKTRF